MFHNKKIRLSCFLDGIGKSQRILLGAVVLTIDQATVHGDPHTKRGHCHVCNRSNKSMEVLQVVAKGQDRKVSCCKISLEDNKFIDMVAVLLDGTFIFQLLLLNRFILIVEGC